MRSDFHYSPVAIAVLLMMGTAGAQAYSYDGAAARVQAESGKLVSSNSLIIDESQEKSFADDLRVDMTSTLSLPVSGDRLVGVGVSGEHDVVLNGASFVFNGMQTESEQFNKSVFGFTTSGASLTVNGDIKADVSGYGLALANIRTNSSLTIRGNVDYRAVQKEFKKDEANYLTTGLFLEDGAQVDIKGDSFSSVVDGVNVRGIYMNGGSSLKIDAADIYFENNLLSDVTHKNHFNQGIYIYQSELTLSGKKASFVVNGENIENRGINLLSDAGDNVKPTLITIDSEALMVDVNGRNDSSYGILTSGAHGKLTVHSSNITVSVEDKYASGLYSQYGAVQHFDNPDALLAIDVKAEASGYGIYNSTYGGKGTNQVGTIIAQGDVIIKVDGQDAAIGVLNENYRGYSADILSDSDGVFLKGSTQIEVTAKAADGEAVGVQADNSKKEGKPQPLFRTEINNLTVTAKGENGASSYGIQGVEQARIVLSGESRIAAVGSNAYGVDINNGSNLDIRGEAVVTGETLGLGLDETSTIGIEENAALGTNSMWSTGTTTIEKNGMLSVTGEVGGSSALGTVAANGGTVQVGSGAFVISDFTGDEKTLRLDDLAADVTVQQNEGSTTLSATGLANDEYSNVTNAAEALQDAVKIENGDQPNKVVIEQGKVNDGLVGTLDKDGNLSDVVITGNSTLDAYGSVAALSAFQWRHDMNDLTKRMGELRMTPQRIGAWARVYGSEQEYGAQSVVAKNNSLQVGVDSDVGAGWRVGAAFTFTDGTVTYDRGEADNKAYGIAAYGSWLADDGQFVDLIAKYSRLENDFDVSGMEGSVDNNAWSISAEYGWHWRLADVGFVEPQVEMTYGQVRGEDITAQNGVRIEQEDFESLIARIGVRSGFYFPKDHCCPNWICA